MNRAKRIVLEAHGQLSLFDFVQETKSFRTHPFFFLFNKAFKDSGVMNLSRMVIARAIFDAVKGDGGAKAFLFGIDPAFNYYCDVLDMNPNFVRQEARKMVRKEFDLPHWRSLRRFWGTY